jgi:hypothetical protein
MMIFRQAGAALVMAAGLMLSLGGFATTASAQAVDPRLTTKRPPPPAVGGQPQRPVVQAPARPVVQAPVVTQQRPVSRPAPQQQQQVRRSGGGGNTGRNVAIGIGAAVLGGVILSEAARAERRRSGVVVIEDDVSDNGGYEDADDRRQRCDDNFRAFDWDSGTYRNRYGERVRCPYLRRRD